MIMSHAAVRSVHGDQVIEVNVSRLDASVAEEFKKEIRSSIADLASGTLVIDLAKVEFLDSSGLGALVAIRKSQPELTTVELRNVSPFVQKVLLLTKMDKVFRF